MSTTPRMSPPRLSAFPPVCAALVGLGVVAFFWWADHYWRAPMAVQFAVQFFGTMVALPVALLKLFRRPILPNLKYRVPDRPSGGIWIIPATLLFILFYFTLMLWLAAHYRPAYATVYYETRGMLRMIRQTPLPLVLLGIVAVAICEETFFRGFLETSLESRIPPAVSSLLVSALFSLAHFDLGKALPVFLGGLWFSVIAHQFRSLAASIVCHFLLNTSGLIGMMYIARAGTRNLQIPEPSALALTLAFAGFMICIVFMAVRPHCRPALSTG